MAKGPEIKMTLNKPSGALRKAFDELPKRVREKGLKQAATAGGTIITRAVRRNVPTDSGLLKKSIGKKVKLYKDSETAVAIIGAKTDVQGEVRGNLRKPSKYIALIEGGAKPHKIQRGNVVVQHPGFAGRHMIAQAEQSDGAAALEAAQNKLAEVIEREAEKMANA